MTVSIACAPLSDGPACCALLAEAFAEFAQRLGRTITPHSYDWVLSAIVEQRVLVAYDGDALCGVLVFYDQHKAHCHLRVIEQVGVLPQMQGFGIGRALLDYAERRAKDDGVDRLNLCTPSMMAHLITLYQGRGFRITHTAVADHGLDPHMRTFMSKAL